MSVSAVCILHRIRESGGCCELRLQVISLEARSEWWFREFRRRNGVVGPMNRSSGKHRLSRRSFLVQGSVAMAPFAGVSLFGSGITFDPQLPTEIVEVETSYGRIRGQRQG